MRDNNENLTVEQQLAMANEKLAERERQLEERERQLAEQQQSRPTEFGGFGH